MAHPPGGRGMTGRGMTGRGMTGRGMTGRGMTGPRMTGPRMTGPRMTGPRMTGPRMTGPPNTAPPNTAPPNTAPPNTAPPNTAPPNTGRGMSVSRRVANYVSVRAEGAEILSAVRPPRDLNTDTLCGRRSAGRQGGEGSGLRVPATGTRSITTDGSR
jgi:hypothetical protein